MKKCIALILVFFVMASSFVVFAENTLEDYENATGTKTSVNASKFVESAVAEPSIYVGQSSSTEYMSTDRKVLVFSGSNAMFGYDVAVDKSGTYEVVAYLASTSKLTVSLLLNGEEVSRGTLEAQPSYSHYMPVNLGTVDLESGDNRIGIKNYSGDGAQFAYFTVECVAGNLGVDAIFANETRIDEVEDVNTKTDAFTIFFNHKLNKELTEDVTISYKDGEIISSEILISDHKIEINLKETLKDETEYEISIGHTEDFMSKSMLDDFIYEFITKSGEPVPNGTISLENVSSEYESITINGNITSSKGLPMKNVTLYADIAGMVKAAETVSEDDGSFTITYILPQDTPSGNMEITVYSDNYENKEVTSVLYVSQDIEDDILESISLAETPEEVATIIEGNEVTLGINIKLDMYAVTDRNLVYRHLAGKTYETTKELLLAYYSFAAVENVNCAKTPRHINGILANEKICEVVGIETEKINALSSANKSDFSNALIDWPEELTDIDSLKKVFKDTTRIFVQKEFNKSDVFLTSDNISVYVGETLEYEMCLNEKADDVKEILILIEADNEILEDCEFKNESSFDCKTEIMDGSLKIIFETDDAQSVEKLGKLTLRTKSIGEYIINQSGAVSYDVGENFLVDACVEENSFSVNVKKNKTTQGSGGGNSSTHYPSSRPSKGSSGGTVTQRPIINQEIVQPDMPEKEPEADVFEFLDMAAHEWAKEAVDELVKKGVISKSEDKKFNPSRYITREEFVKLVVCALNIETEGKTADFSDVSKDAWCYKYIAAAKEAGIIQGDGGKFGTGNYITREDMATILYRATKAKLSDSMGTEKFADDDNISAYAKDAVYVMRANRIINGVGDNSFMPKNNATRAESAKMIYELIKVVK